MPLELAGDALTALGAFWVLLSAIRTRRELARGEWTYDKMQATLDVMKAAIENQARDQAVGFAMLVAGFAIKLWPTLSAALFP